MAVALVDNDAQSVSSLMALMTDLVPSNCATGVDVVRAAVFSPLPK